MNGTHTFATTNVMAQRRTSSASSSADADLHTGFEAGFGFRTEEDESRTEADDPRIEEDDS